VVISAGSFRNDNRRTSANSYHSLFLAMSDPASHPSLFATDFATSLASATTGHAFSSGAEEKVN
jgi:hypothetical protein